MVCITRRTWWKSCWISLIEAELLILVSIHYFLLSIFKSPLWHHFTHLKLTFMHIIAYSRRGSKGALISFRIHTWKLSYLNLLIKANCFVCWWIVSICMRFVSSSWITLFLCFSLQRHCSTSSWSSALRAGWGYLRLCHHWLLSYRMPAIIFPSMFLRYIFPILIP